MQKDIHLKANKIKDREIEMGDKNVVDQLSGSGVRPAEGNQIGGLPLSGSGFQLR